jgi:hypothetical protein
MNSCIHCSYEIDKERLEFLLEFNKPLTCKNCSMEQPYIGYKEKPKVVKSKTDAQLRKINEKYEQIKQDSKTSVTNDLKEYKKFWKKIQQKRKSK